MNAVMKVWYKDALMCLEYIQLFGECPAEYTIAARQYGDDWLLGYGGYLIKAEEGEVLRVTFECREPATVRDEPNHGASPFTEWFLTSGYGDQYRCIAEAAWYAARASSS